MPRTSFGRSCKRAASEVQCLPPPVCVCARADHVRSAASHRRWVGSRAMRPIARSRGATVEQRPTRRARHPALRDLAGLVVVHRVPRAPRRPTCCRARRRARPRAPHGTTIVAAQLRRRRGDGRRPPRHRRQPDRPARHREGVRRRRLLPGRHRRHRRPGDRDRAAVPGRARALREDRGHPAHPRRQGQPARHDDPRQPRRRRMQGLAVVPLFAGFDLDAADAADARQDLQLRRHRRPLPRAVLPRGRLAARCSPAAR